MNGSSMNGVVMSDMTPPSPADHPDLVRQRGDLEREFEALRLDLIETRSRVAARDAAMKAALREELIASRERLAAMEAEHRRQLEEIRAATQAHVDQVITDAQREIGELT